MDDGFGRWEKEAETEGGVGSFKEIDIKCYFSPKKGEWSSNAGWILL